MINANNMCTKTSFDVDNRYMEVKSFRNMFDYCSILEVCLFMLMFYVPVSNFSVMSGRFPVFLV